MTLDSRYKTFWPRLGAAFLDSAALAPLIWIDQVLWNSTSYAILLFIWMMIYQALSIGYSVGFLYFFGQTPGKMATGVLILDKSEQRLTLSQAILRNIVQVILVPIFIIIVSNNLLAGRLANRGLGDPRFLMWFFGAMMVWAILEFITMLFNSKRRAVHDFIAGTVVVRQPIDERNRNYLKIRWALIILLVLNIIIPRLLPERNMQFGNLTTEDSLLAIEPYPIIRERFPEDFNKLNNAFIASLNNNDTKEQAIAKLRPIFMDVLMSKLPISSNSALTSFNQHALAVLGYFHNLGRDEDAFNYMFDQSRLPKEWYKSLPKELRDGEMSLYREIFSSADPRNNTNIDKVKAEMLIGKIASELVNKYGSKADLLQNPQAPQNNRSDVVEIIIAYYSGIMKLPESDRGLVLRYSLSSS